MIARFFSVTFFTIPKSKYDFLSYRHQIDSALYSQLSAKFELKHLKFHSQDYIPKKPHKDEIYFKGSSGFFHFPLSAFLFIRRASPEVLFLHGFVFPFQVLLLRFFIPRKIKILVQHHAEQPFKNRIKRLLQKLSYSRADAYLFSSLDLANSYLDAKIIRDKNKIYEVMEGSSAFKKKELSLAKKNLSIPNENVFLWVGRLNDNKDPMLVLKAFERYKKTTGDFILYMIYGTSELENEIKHFIRVHDLNEHVKLIGNVKHENLEDWYSAADYFVAASHYEGSGIALCEAMSCSCIPIVTNIPSFKMMTSDGKFGYLFEPNNEGALVDILSKLNHSEKAKMKEKVFEQFHRKLSLTAIGEDILSIVTELIQK